MNLDLLQKLTRLANHNPNDNEANVAARRVCKMLEEADWKLIAEQPKRAADKVPYTPPKPANADDWQGFNRGRAKTRTQEDAIQDLIDEMFKRTGFDYTSYHTKREQEKPRYNPIYDEYRKSNHYTTGEPKMRECVTCKKMVSTQYVGNLFKCADCLELEFKAKYGDF